MHPSQTEVCDDRRATRIFARNALQNIAKKMRESVNSRLLWRRRCVILPLRRESRLGIPAGSLAQNAQPRWARRPLDRRFGQPSANATPMRTALPGRGRQCTQPQSLEGAIDAERHVAARFVFEIVAGEAPLERDLQAAKTCLHERAATACVILLIAERAAFDAEGEERPKAIARPRQAPIFLKCGSIGCID